MKVYTVYHGTQYGSSAKKLLDMGKAAIEFHPNPARKIPGNLGYGFYTFLHDGEMAEAFASKFGDKPIVFELSVVLPPEHTLSFDISEEDRQDYQKWLQLPNVRREVERQKRKYRNASRQKSLDGALVEAFCQMLKDTRSADVYAVRSTTTTAVGIDIPGSAIPNGVEVLIKDASIIIDEHFRVYHSSDSAR